MKEMGAIGSVPSPVEDDATRGSGPLVPLAARAPRPLRQQVFECVRALGPVSRSDVARDLGVSPGSVTTATAELIEAGYLHEVDTPRGPGDATRGRPPVALGVRPGAGHVGGVRLGDRGHAAAILDLSGRRIGAAVSVADGASREPASLAAEAGKVLARALRGTGLGPGDLAAVGLGLPGIVDHEAGHVHWSPLLDPGGTGLAERLSAGLGCPVRIDNDANLVALAEHWFGAGRALPDFAVVTIDQGIGMGLVLNHRMFRGAKGLGMELGHTKLALDGALCRCGKRGCLEAYVAEHALIREAETVLGRSGTGRAADLRLLDRLTERAGTGCAAARGVLEHADLHLAAGLANIVNLFDPGLILLCAPPQRFRLMDVERVRRLMAGLMMDAGRVAPRVETREGSDMIGAEGAAALALASATDAVLGAEAGG